MTSSAVRVAYDLMRLTNRRGFRVMFNSLHAWASVNHLHLHSMNVDQELGMDSCPTLPIGRSSHLRRLDPTKSHLAGYAVNLLPNEKPEVLEAIVKNVETIVEFFHRNEIPYNCTWARGTDLAVAG